ncbi:hypothetical protein QGM71_02950 [Virgibacillus sp. C22-A2]|uniref:Uncharacterized protein n=2 Tax=Virgibacillus tibetensis TaxID=3042313 RepID=A0ABU6KDC5_9BACI|nr:hypothetical protein [Virgibacillus sp. C22-A2]
MKKTKKRLFFACWILLSISFSRFYITLESYSISVAFLIILGGSIILLIKLPNLMYHLISSYTITIGYAAILMWEKNAPVWMILPRHIQIPLILTLTIILLEKSLYGRLSICLLGVCGGEMIYSLTLFGYGFQESIGEMHFFDSLFFIIVILAILDILHNGKNKLFLFMENYKGLVRWRNE